MKALEASSSPYILIIGPINQTLSDWPMTFVYSVQEAEELLKLNPYPVLVIVYDSLSFHETDRFIEKLPLSKKIIFIGSKIKKEHLISFVKKRSLFKILSSPSQLEEALTEVLGELKKKEQDEALFSLLKEENEALEKSYEKLSLDLVSKKKALKRAVKKRKREFEFLQFQQEAFMKIHKASFEGELESTLNDFLKLLFSLSWVKLDLSYKKLPLEKLKEEFEVLEIPLAIENNPSATLYFAKNKGASFFSYEENLLTELAETVSLALNRFQKLRINEDLQKEWQATFQAVSHPFCLTDKKFRIFEANKAFLKKINKKLSEVVLQDAREIFLGKPYPPSCEKESSFEFVVKDKKGRIYEMRGQKILLDERWFDYVIFVLIFRDITEQKQLEERILKTSKDTELGIISSSMAHELNNPLGSILSFIQLIKMQNTLDSQTKGNLDSMERATLKCRQIVIDLLEFMRKESQKPSSFLSDFEKKSQFDSLKKNKLK